MTGGTCDNRQVAVTQELCPGCGVQLPKVTGPTHRYMTSSPSCWRHYGELLAAQYQEPERMSFHQLVVDAYAVQHPGQTRDDPRAVQSVAIHLMTLCLFLERGADPALGTRLHKHMVDRPVFHWLDPPSTRGQLTVADVATGPDAAAARSLTYAWAADAWAAWGSHHKTVRRWLDESGFDSLP